jgi:hypothetical protein
MNRIACHGDAGRHTFVMGDPWTPPLSVSEVGGRCRLSLGGHAHGDGASLQEAADDLVRRLLSLAMELRSSRGFRLSPEGPAVDFRWFELLYELGAIAARGEDIRPRIFERPAA